MTPNEKKEFNRIKRKLKRNKISSYKEFKDKCLKDYNYSLKKTFLQDFKLGRQIPCGYWTEKRVKIVASRYSRRIDFFRKCHGGYKAAFRLGLLDKLKFNGDEIKTKWDEEKILKEAKKYTRIIDFQKKGKGAYNAGIKLGIKTKMLSHMKKRTIWTEALIKKEAKKYINRTQFFKKNGSAYNAARRLGVLEEVCSNMNPVVEKRKLSDKRLAKEAKKYNSRGEFREKDNYAYSLSCKRKILNKITKHMSGGTKPQGYWKDEKNVYKEAAKYKTRREFFLQNATAYGMAMKLKILQKACSHMDFVVDRREQRFQTQFVKKIEKKLSQNGINFEIKQEVWLAKGSRIDIMLEIPDYGVILPIELKHGESGTNWSNNKIKKQIKKYDNFFKGKSKFTSTYLISPKGKWGYSEKEFLEILEHLIKYEELYLPCAVA